MRIKSVAVLRRTDGPDEPDETSIVAETEASDTEQSAKAYAHAAENVARGIQG